MSEALQKTEPKETQERFWKSPNFAITHDHLFPAREPGSLPLNSSLITVRANRDHFPPHIQKFADLEKLQFAMRSRYAQLGLEAMSLRMPFSTLAGQPKFNGAEWARIQAGEEVEVPIQVNSWAARPIEMPAGTEVFRLFAPVTAKQLTGDALRQAVEDGKIAIGGSDWTWAGLRTWGEPRGIHVPIDPHLRWIEPGTEPIFVSGDDHAYRARIDAYHSPVPDTEKDIVWITETPHMTLGKSVNAIISEHPSQENQLGVKGGGFGYHIASQLVDSGSDWPIRVEVVSPTVPKERLPKTILFEFFE